jgi:Mg-chelatase subunit ChlD
MAQSNLPKVQQFSMLIEESIPLATASDSVGEAFSLASGPQISRGKIGFGSGVSFSRSVAQAPRLLGVEVQAPLPEITGLTRPDVALVKVARHLLSTRTSDTMDIVFVIDASQSMRNDIDAVRNHLNQMTDLLKAKKLDFTIGLVAFRSGTTFSLLGWDFQITPQTTSLRQIKKALNGIRCRGGEKASDALVRAAGEVKFRKGAERRFILVTDEYISGSYPAKVVLEKLKAAKIYVDASDARSAFKNCWRRELEDCGYQFLV